MGATHTRARTRRRLLSFALLRYTPQLAAALAQRCVEAISRGGRAIVADPGRPSRRLFQAALEQQGMRAAFVQPAQASAGASIGEARLVLLQIDGEHSVSAFEARAELEG